MSEPLLLVELDRIVSYTDAWPRHELDSDRVALFMDLYGDGDGDPTVLPPLEVTVLPAGEFLLTDGWHRLEALFALKVEQARVSVVDSGQLSPELFAYQRGLQTCTTASRPLSRAERRPATERLLSDRPELTDVAIAQLVGVSNATVGRVRHLLQNPPEPTNDSDREDQHPQAAEHAKVNRQLVRQLSKLWDSRPVLMAAGLRDTAALGDSLAQALIEEHGPREARVWAQRLSTWAQRATAVTNHAVTDRAASNTTHDLAGEWS